MVVDLGLPQQRAARGVEVEGCSQASRSVYINVVYIIIMDYGM